MHSPPPHLQAAEYVPVNAFVQSYFGFKHSFTGWTVLILIGFIFFFRAISLLALTKLNYQNR